jgi:cytochrome c oxidase assembly protein subunit 15
MDGVDGSSFSWHIRGVPSHPNPNPRFFKAVVGTLVATVFVILFGAVVRITGSGAGCGQHWPTCQGEVAHLPRTLETLIEFTHRITSGLLGLAIFVLTTGAFVLLERAHPARKWLVFSSIFLIIEALIGRRLVKLSLVGTDASVERAVMMPLHLVNTSLLLGTLALATFACWPQEAPSRARSPRGAALVGLGLLAVVAVSASGALTALGDTVYPTRLGLSGIAADPGKERHFLEHLRVFHPLLAVALVVALLRLLPRAVTHGSTTARRLARVSIGLLLAQAALGALNVLLSAPGYMQVVHLFVACLIWLAMLLLAAELWAPRHFPAPAPLGFEPDAAHGRASGSSFDAPETSTRSMR